MIAYAPHNRLFQRGRTKHRAYGLNDRQGDHQLTHATYYGFDHVYTRGSRRTGCALIALPAAVCGLRCVLCSGHRDVIGGLFLSVKSFAIVKMGKR